MAGDGWLKVKLIMEVVEMTFRTVIFILFFFKCIIKRVLARYFHVKMYF